MTTALRQVQVPRLLRVGGGLLPELRRLLDDSGFDLSAVAVVTGSGPSAAWGSSVHESVGGGAALLRTSSGSLAEAAGIAGEVIANGWTLLIAVGGGRVIDTAKLAAGRTGVDLVTCPTTAAHDGLCSPVASLIGADGVRRSHAALMPAGVVLDTDVLMTAPARTLRAGVGDLLSNLTALMDWRGAGALGLEEYDEFSAMIAESAARPALDLCALGDRASVEQLAHGLVLSGLAMATAGTSRPCSGAEHLISHALDAALGPRAALHGEQVALGALVSATAHGALAPEIRKTLTAVGLPTAPDQLGLTREQMRRAVLSAPATRPDRWTVLSGLYGDEQAVDALCADAFGGAW